jgi:hypothetical protein
MLCTTYNIYAHGDKYNVKKRSAILPGKSQFFIVKGIICTLTELPPILAVMARLVPFTVSGSANMMALDYKHTVSKNIVRGLIKVCCVKAGKPVLITV